jgi:GMP synthase-like glutamine amidotransferase
MVHINKERCEMMLESETGSKTTSKDDFQKANMQYCLGFEKEDGGFKEFIPFRDNIENIDFSKCAGVVLSGSEMNVLDDTDESHMKATLKVRSVVREAKEKGVPIMGICFGGQLLANENGAEIEWVKGENGKHTRMQGIQYIKKTAKMLDRTELFPELEALDTVVESHGQQINSASIFNKGEILAENPINHAPEIVLFGDKEICLQFHPEVGSLRVEIVRTVTEEKYVPENTLNTDLLSTRKIFFHSFLKLVEKSNHKK